MPGPRTRVRLRVQPGARRAEVVGRHAGGRKSRVAAAPARGRANADAPALPARVLAVPRSAVALVSGWGARDKIVEVTGMGPEHVDRRPAGAGGRGSQ